MTFLVEGRRFTKRLHAITFAIGLASEQGRSIDVKVETVDFQNHRQRSWVCRMHPPDKLVTILKRPDLSHVYGVAL